MCMCVIKISYFICITVFNFNIIYLIYVLYYIYFKLFDQPISIKEFLSLVN